MNTTANATTNNDSAKLTQQQKSYIDDYLNYLSDKKNPSEKLNKEEYLENQNIFFLLGIEEGTEEERDQFLDELQQVVWEDFLENDCKLLVTDGEWGELKKILDQKNKDELQIQEEAIGYLERLIPDLDEIMLEKALEIKEDMVRERVTSLKDLYQDKVEVLQKVAKAEQLFVKDRWKSGAEILNSIQVK